MASDFVQMSLLDLMVPEVVESPQPGSPGYQYDTDGITPERFEGIPVPVPKKTGAELVITVACGDSGNWYFGRDIKHGTEGCLYGPWPKFSDKFTSRYEAIKAAIENIRVYLSAKKEKRNLKEILVALDAFAERVAVDQVLDQHNQHKELAALINKAGYSRCQAKAILGGFSLVEYRREEKAIYESDLDRSAGLIQSYQFETYAAAERKLKELLKDPLTLETSEGKISMQHGTAGKLFKAGFDFYRICGLAACETDLRIKQGSKNWGTWSKCEDVQQLKDAWNKLMKEDMKALEG